MQSSPCLRNVILLLAFCSMLATVCSAACGGCMENNVACVNGTHYRFCINSSPIENGGILSCGAGKICTSLLDPCWTKEADDGVEPVCNVSNTNCRSCDGSQMFVCTSHTTFQQCNNRTLSPQINTCPAGTVCSIDSGEFCVKACKLTSGIYECDKPAP